MDRLRTELDVYLLGVSEKKESSGERGRLVRTRSHIPFIPAIMFAPHLPYFMTLPYSHNTDGGSRETEDDIGDCLGGIGQG